MPQTSFSKCTQGSTGNGSGSNVKLQIAVQCQLRHQQLALLDVNLTSVCSKMAGTYMCSGLRISSTRSFFSGLCILPLPRLGHVCLCHVALAGRPHICEGRCESIVMHALMHCCKQAYWCCSESYGGACLESSVMMPAISGDTPADSCLLHCRLT